ncbi:(3,5-dihydroxyphenyl)acetyl-CoA 1,2-dioxygenase DpgC [Nocardia sp. NPDC051570]|uniref:(3,5-dihydroxyphenyl)acetyl-CoA 1,2-dioxygenase DpgC n=1 Tax=Nocardia sp. NPDC051570 TaxID=3364324 RepID=UPI0037A4C1CA
MTTTSHGTHQIPPDPTVTGRLTSDAAALRDHTARIEDLLGDLPARPDRSPGQQRRAAELHRVARQGRTAFLRAHAATVYERLPDGLRLPELTEAASQEFPGLAPTAQQMAAEAQLLQAYKEGREIDQGILLRELLRLPEPGTRIIEAMQRPTEWALGLQSEFARTGCVELASAHLERRDAIGHITIHNEDSLNAEDNRLVADLETVVDLVLLDEGTRVGVLRGAPMTHPRYAGRRVFSAGINLKHLHQGRISYVNFLMGREIGLINKLLRGILLAPDGSPSERVVEKPWLAAVDTFAIGGGMQLLLVLDRVLTADDAYFSLPAAQEGIVPGAANLRLSRVLGERLAKQVILGGRVIRATDPEARLLCDEVLAPEALDEQITRSATQLAVPSVVPNRRMLNLAIEPLDEFRTYMAEFALTQAIRLYSQDVADKVGEFSTKAQSTKGAPEP